MPAALDGGSGGGVGGGEDFEVSLGPPAAPGAVDDAAGFFDPGDLLEGEGGAQQIFGELAAAFRIVGGNGLVAGVEAEAIVFPVQELAAHFHRRHSLFPAPIWELIRPLACPRGPGEAFSRKLISLFWRR